MNNAFRIIHISSQWLIIRGGHFRNFFKISKVSSVGTDGMDFVLRLNPPNVRLENDDDNFRILRFIRSW